MKWMVMDNKFKILIFVTIFCLTSGWGYGQFRIDSVRVQQTENGADVQVDVKGGHAPYEYYLLQNDTLLQKIQNIPQTSYVFKDVEINEESYTIKIVDHWGNIISKKDLQFSKSNLK